MTQLLLTDYHAKYFAHELTKRCSSDSLEKLAGAVASAQVDLNPHQVEAALFAFKSPLSNGAILADEVGLGKTIEAGLVLSQKWAEGKRRIMIIVPASLRKQWNQELSDKFFLPSHILEAKSFKDAIKKGKQNPFEHKEILICSYPFAARHHEKLMQVRWDLVVLDEAHRLRNVYKKQNKTARVLKVALANTPKILLTATPLQNSLMELYGLVSFVDELAFGDEKAFRSQYGSINDQTSFDSLKARLKPICHRTLRRQVLEYVKYTNRQPITQAFWPTEKEQDLYNKVSAYLQRPELFALPNSQRKLMTLVMRKLLASSTFAIAGALDSLTNKLRRQLKDNKELVELNESLNEELEENFESLGEYRDENSNEEDEFELPPEQLTADEMAAIEDEILELQSFRDLAVSVSENAKGLSLLDALKAGFAKAKQLGAQDKAIIFTESRRTQSYLVELLSRNGYGEKIVLFNGTNSDEQSKVIYKDWIEKHKGTDRVSGSRSADMRAALVEHFRDSAQIMIATEAAAEGINLQFCSLLVNYDLPWNPQRIEQRIGRCHRYGQKHDVVVINFLNQANAADLRVFELLDKKFNLFNGVFGASDEVLGAITSGVDFENRIAEIYQTCREPKQIDFQFEALRTELDEQISLAMQSTRQKLLENFDAEVHERLKVNLKESKEYLDKYSQRLWQLTQQVLRSNATFDMDATKHRFSLQSLPASLMQEGIPLGKYELGKNIEDAHTYRIGHPLAQWVIESAKSKPLPLMELNFDYKAFGTTAKVLEPLLGCNGWLKISLLTIETFGQAEDHIVVAANSSSGKVVSQQAVEMLLNVPVSSSQPIEAALPEPVAALAEANKRLLIDTVNQRNLGFFAQEIDKLDNWADDQKQGLEQSVKDLEKDIREVRKQAKTALTLEDKLQFQKQQRDLEAKRNKLRKELFDRQDEVDVRRDQLIVSLEDKLVQKISGEEIFTVKWNLK